MEKRQISFTGRQWEFVKQEAARLETSPADVVRRMTDTYIDSGAHITTSTLFRSRGVTPQAAGGSRNAESESD